jgi:hypothetical protein
LSEKRSEQFARETRAGSDYERTDIDAEIERTGDELAFGP